MLFEVGPYSAEIQASDNQKAGQLILQFALSRGYNGDIQDGDAIIAFSLVRLKEYIISEARNRYINSAQVAARNTARQELDTIDFADDVVEPPEEI